MKQNESPTRRWRRIGGAVAVTVATLATPVLTAAPAAAVSETLIHPEIIDGCEGCPGPMVKVQAVLEERTVVTVTASLAKGVSGLIAASETRDPAVAKRLHDTAVRWLATGAAQAGNSAWAADDWDGDLCPRRPWPWPGPKPHWDEVQTWLADGMTVLGAANRTGDARLLADASRRLDAGAVGLTDFQGCV